MITEKHNNGVCFRMDIKYMIDPGDGLVNEKTVYGEDRDELLKWLNDNYSEIYVFDIHIKDDSK